MRRYLQTIALVIVLALAYGMPAWAAEDDGSQVKILSPQAGAVIQGDTLELQYDLLKGTKAQYVHVYLDGQYQKGFAGTFKGLAPGKHEIRVVAATQDHKVLAAESAVTIEVQAQGDTGGY